MNLEEAIRGQQLYNPYDFANPVSDQYLFAGRDKELADIKYYLQLAGSAPRPINLVLTGPRSAGKTSLLNRIESEAQRYEYTTARIDLNEGDADPFALFYKIYDALLLAAVTGGALGGPGGRIYAEYRETIDAGTPPRETTGTLIFPRHHAVASQNGRALSEPTLKADLTTISRETGKLAVLIFDECDVLGKSRIELEILRNVFMNMPGYMLVFSGTPNLFPVMEEVFSPIIRQFKKIPVHNFARIEDTEACIFRPLEQIGIDPSEVTKPNPYQLAYEVHRLSAGRPYEIQLLCHVMFKRVETGDARNMEITLDVLDDVRQELEQQESGTERLIVTWLRQLGPSDFSLLQALTEFRGTVAQLSASSMLFRSAEPSYSVEELQEAYERFSAVGLVVMDSTGVVRFNGDQFDEVYARYAAAASNVRLSVWLGAFERELESELGRVLDALDDADVVYFPLELSRSDSRRRVDEAITALLSPEPARSLPDTVTALYPRLITTFERGVFVLARVELSVMGTTIDQWVTIDTDDLQNFLADDRLVAIRVVAEGLGGTLTVELFEQPVSGREPLLSAIRSAASPNQAVSFSQDHYSYALHLYNLQDFFRARREFLTANLYVPSISRVVAAAHTSLLLGDHELAYDYSDSARTSALESEEEDALLQYGFATYDMAIALLMQGHASPVASLLSEAAACFGPNTVGYLATPQQEAGVTTLVPRDVDDTRAAIEAVIRTLP